MRSREVEAYIQIATVVISAGTILDVPGDHTCQPDYTLAVRSHFSKTTGGAHEPFSHMGANIGHHMLASQLVYIGSSVADNREPLAWYTPMPVMEQLQEMTSCTQRRHPQPVLQFEMSRGKCSWMKLHSHVGLPVLPRFTVLHRLNCTPLLPIRQIGVVR